MHLKERMMSVTEKRKIKVCEQVLTKKSEKTKNQHSEGTNRHFPPDSEHQGG